MESPLQKKPPGIKSALLTVANVIIEIIMQPPKFFLRLRDVTLYVLYVCMLFFPQLFFFFFGLLSFFVVVVVAISWAAPAAYGGSQARGWIGAEATGLCQSHSNADPYTTAHGNARSLTHWARAGTEPATSWFLVGFVNHFATTGTPQTSFTLRKCDFGSSC